MLHIFIQNIYAKVCAAILFEIFREFWGGPRIHILYGFYWHCAITILSHFYTSCIDPELISSFLLLGAATKLNVHSHCHCQHHHYLNFQHASLPTFLFLLPPVFLCHHGSDLKLLSHWLAALLVVVQILWWADLDVVSKRMMISIPLRPVIITYSYLQSPILLSKNAEVMLAKSEISKVTCCHHWYCLTLNTFHRRHPQLWYSAQCLLQKAPL